ncbi:MAG TPA: aminopeptidase P N-terminal domain-containing protein, partial [Vicinamibacteria bacterium]|nr:aminopeptidase P N-terminal domain-containing protein [Vicinamibacteria bacterium]
MIALLLLLSAQVPVSEHAERRERLMASFADGIVLLHARSTPSSLGESSFKQDATFLYFSGLANQPGAILTLDGARKESRLFVPAAPVLFGAKVEGAGLAPGQDSARAHGFTTVEPWEGFPPYIEKRLSEGVKKLYTDEARNAEFPGNPPSMSPVAGDKLLWRLSLEKAFPGVEIASAESVIRAMRWAKSPSEVAILREVARTSALALLSGIRAVEAGQGQRPSEMAVVSACFEAGAVSPSFWPWTMSGPNAHLGNVVLSFFDYQHLDRKMKDGELVRMDVGCALGHYEGDVGRTVPVSGKFNSDQRETLDLLVRAYRAGLSAMKAGVPLETVMARARAEVESAKATLQSDYARRAAETILAAPLAAAWHIHGVGLDGGETGTDTLEAGSVIAFEPMFSVDADAFYMEDMILVTASGHEVLTQGLP